MKESYRLFRHHGIYYAEHRETRKQESLRTRDAAEARRLLHAKNEAAAAPGRPGAGIHDGSIHEPLRIRGGRVASRGWSHPLERAVHPSGFDAPGPCDCEYFAFSRSDGTRRIADGIRGLCSRFVPALA